MRSRQAGEAVGGGSGGDLRSELVDHARRLVARGGPGALTMRALASEAGCALGLPYKVFRDRGELVIEIMRVELTRLKGAGEELLGRAGGDIASNLTWYAEMILDSPAVALSTEVVGDPELAGRFADLAGVDGMGPDGFDSALRAYFEVERGLGRVRNDIDLGSVAFLVAGSIHNLVVSGPAYPRPSRAEVGHHMSVVAALIAIRPI